METRPISLFFPLRPGMPNKRRNRFHPWMAGDLFGRDVFAVNHRRVLRGALSLGSDFDFGRNGCLTQAEQETPWGLLFLGGTVLPLTCEEP